MRVLFCQTFPYPPSEGGGALSNTHELCQLLPAHGFEVAALAGVRRDAWSSLRSLGRRRSGIEDRQLGYPVYRASDPLAAAESLARKQRPDVAVVQVGDVLGLCRVFLTAGIPTIFYCHDWYTVPPPGELPSHPLLSFAACSSALAERIRCKLNVETPVVPVLVQPDRYRTRTTRQVVTFVNPIPRKGVEIAFALAARRPDIPFEFVESWQLRTRVAKMMQSRVAHHGNVRLVRRSDDMRSIYGRSRIVLAPSLYHEAWGRIVSEAQVSGIPAIASNSGGLPEAVGPGGLILDRDAPLSAWLEALGRLWDDPVEYERYARQAAAYATRPEIQPATVVARMIEVVKRSHAATRRQSTA
jgi:glycosyltransferase involved in cell wall biosynthesis